MTLGNIKFLRFLLNEHEILLANTVMIAFHLQFSPDQSLLSQRTLVIQLLVTLQYLSLNFL